MQHKFKSITKQQGSQTVRRKHVQRAKFKSITKQQGSQTYRRLSDMDFRFKSITKQQGSQTLSAFVSAPFAFKSITKQQGSQTPTRDKSACRRTVVLFLSLFSAKNCVFYGISTFRLHYIPPFNNFQLFRTNLR